MRPQGALSTASLCGMVRPSLLTVLLVLGGAGCSLTTAGGEHVASTDRGIGAADRTATIEEGAAAPFELGGTSWELLAIQSMDDQRWVPDDPSRYTLVFDVGGQVFMQLDCNRGRSNWSSEQFGQLRFGLLASTNALCHDEGLSERYAAQLEYVRSYLLRNGHLFLATMADGAILEFQPASTGDGD